MNLFFSGGPTDQIELDTRLQPGVRYRLMSCHEEYIRQAHKTSQALIAAQQPFELMYDSGAFTAWSKGKEVVLDDLMRVYDAMLEKYESHSLHTWLISLDKIPGSKGRTATPEEIDEAVRVSDENFAILEKRYGERVLPVFHQNESDARLHEVAAMAPYICVSPRNDLHEGSRRKWSQEVHAKIPGKKTHGLAATGHAMMTQVPWGSVDSATWVLLAANGAVFRDSRLRTLHISDQAGSIKDKDQHYRTMPPGYQKEFADFAESRGFTINQLETNFYDRMIFNRVLMTEVMVSLPAPDVIAQSTPIEESLFGL